MLLAWHRGSGPVSLLDPVSLVAPGTMPISRISALAALVRGLSRVVHSMDGDLTLERKPCSGLLCPLPTHSKLSGLRNQQLNALYLSLLVSSSVNNAAKTLTMARISGTFASIDQGI